ncbi:MRPL24 [Bugula neritina]|uniref:Large ribosomal subunit protein uL24m n=1 Tax=Bugula neritina TaxID=10212 RepID=A0A7J7J354_BUGNE|nr:MRPL24 [Bugula neritina]
MVRVTCSLLQRVPQYWKRYTDRCINLRSKPARYVALRGWVGEDKRHWWLYTEDHPSTVENQSANMEKNNLAAEIEFMEELLEPIKERTVHIGDRVEVLVGRDKGKQGIVSKIVPQRNWVFVEGLNKQYQSRDVSGAATLLSEEMPLNVTSEIALVDPITEKAASKVEWRYTEEGKRVRVTLPSGAILQPTAFSRVLADGVDPAMYIDNNKTDTTEKQLKTPTYKPNLKTFEQDIMDSMGIVENKKRGKTYWY